MAFAPAGSYTVESWSATATVDEFAGEFDGWAPRLIELIRAGDAPGRWALLDRAPLRRWSTGPVTLLGDAAHPMFPFFAQGAAQAVEDAALLALCLPDGPGQEARDRSFARADPLVANRWIYGYDPEDTLAATHDGEEVSP